MPRRHQLALILGFAQIAFTFADGNCSFFPVHIPVKDVDFTNGGFARGIALSVGNPPQDFAFLPQAQMVNTWLYNASGFCPKKDTQAECLTYRGGLFVEENSVTFKPATSEVEVGSSKSEDRFHTEHWGIDDVEFNGTSKFPGYYFGMPGVDLTNAPGIGTGGNLLGLGPDATITSLLRKANWIGSRTWSLWWGLMGVEGDARMDGGLVLGGYDKAKIRGSLEQNYTGQLGSNFGPCDSGMIVTITSISLHFPNGSEPNLLDPQTGIPIQACIQPEADFFMSMPLDPYYDLFQDLIGHIAFDRSVGLNFFTMLFHPEDAFQGDISLTINSDWDVRVPNSQIVMPYQVIQDDGHVQTHSEVSDLLIYNLEGVNGDDMPRLGRYFLTAAHLFVDHDAGTFTLWEAEPTINTDLVSVLDDDVDADCGSSTVDVGPVNTDKPPSPSNSTDQEPQASHADGNSDGTNIPALIGGIMGAGVAIALIILMLGIFIRRRRGGDQSWKALLHPRRKETSEETSIGPTQKPLPFLQEPAPAPQELWGQYYPKSRPDSRDAPRHELE